MKKESLQQSLVFIDESGDAGFKFEKGSSVYFIISAVIFNDFLEAEKTAVAIKEMRRKEKFPDNFEFKFNNSKRKIREKFLETVKPFNFKIRYLIINKKKIKSDELKHNKNSFYSYVIKMLLKHSNNTILNAKIKIDGSGDRIFKRNFAVYLRKNLNSCDKKIIQNLRFADSKENVLIQLADMVAGSERRYFEYKNGLKTDAEIYRDIIKRKINDEWEFK
ncbi:MAG: DUF3800 domain-containing protein [Patescibacteria group bacterium]